MKVSLDRRAWRKTLSTVAGLLLSMWIINDSISAYIVHISYEKTFSALIPALITLDKVLISIHRIARIIWRIKILRRTGTNII